MSLAPTGTVMLLFTDIEDSTQLAQTLPERWPAMRVTSCHPALVASAVAAVLGVRDEPDRPVLATLLETPRGERGGAT
jgi:hypothetical protein